MQRNSIQKWDEIYEFDKIIKKEKPALKKYNKSDLIYDSRYSIYSYLNITNSISISPESKYPILLLVYTELNKINNLKLQKGHTKEKKRTLYNTSSELYSTYLGIYFGQHMAFPDASKKELGDKCNPINLFLDIYNYDDWFENEEFGMLPLKCDEEKVKEEKGLKILTPNKLVTRLSILLARNKVWNNSYNLKYEIRLNLYLLYQHNKIIKKVYKNFTMSFW